MDTPVWINVGALVVAAIAVGVSSVFTHRALRLSRNANHLPVVINLLAPHRSPSFLAKEDFLADHIAEHDPAAGFKGLPEPIRSHAVEVCQQYHLLGYLSRYGLADRDVLVAQVRHGALRTWMAVEPHVRGERRLRGGDYTFFNSFEDFATAAAAMDPEAEMARSYRSLLPSRRIQ